MGLDEMGLDEVALNRRFYIFVSGVAITRHQCARPHPMEGYITCYLGNISVEER